MATPDVAVLEPFDVCLNDDNGATTYGKQGGVYPYTFIDGHWALLAALDPGEGHGHGGGHGHP